jgi:succinate dehydrogenase hydrophobic anchor subunit
MTFDRKGMKKWICDHQTAIFLAIIAVLLTIILWLVLFNTGMPAIIINNSGSNVGL